MNIDDLLVPRHPLPRLQEQQVESLQQLPETERAEQAQLLRLGNAAYRYHPLADPHLTEADFQHWLPGLPPHPRQAMATAGFGAAGSN